MIDKQLQFVIDEEGKQTAVILTIDMFHAMLDTIEELEEHYYSHHPEEKELRNTELEALNEEEQ